MLDKNDSKLHQKQEELTKIIYDNPEMLPSRYVFVLTNLCNLKCNFCFQDKRLNKNAMTSDNWIDLAKQLPDYARVTMTGGEPLIFSDFKKVFKYVAERFDCNIITNGLLLNEDIVELMLSYPNFEVLSVSIDDIGNKAREFKDEQWRYLIKILKYFVKRRNELDSKCVLDIKTTVLDSNTKDLFSIFKFFMEEVEPDTHVFQFLKGSSIQHSDIMFEFNDILKKSNAHVYKDFDVIKEQLEKVKELCLERNKKCYLHPKVASLVTESSLPNIDYLNDRNHVRERFSHCKAPWSSVHINVDGNLFPCLAVSMGNVKETSLNEIIRGEKMTEFRKLIRSKGTIEACNRCGWLRPNIDIN